jgi:vacuolar-type H+-ATPase subunit C/Vma6
MIDNIILLITGTLHQRPISELISKCHPLGSFEQMEAIHIANTPAELYNAVLVDTPLGTMTHSVHLPYTCFVQLRTSSTVSTNKIWMM